MNLREKLSSLTQLGNEHIRAVKDIAVEFPHSIVPINSSIELSRYNCLMYAFGFAGKSDYEDIAGLPHINVFAGKQFANWLLKNDYLKSVTKTKILVGDLVIYLDENDEFLHIGVLAIEMRVNSKWGNQGLYNHNFFEVPASYGDSIGYYKSIDFPVAIELFKDFAALNGVTFQ